MADAVAVNRQYLSKRRTLCLGRTIGIGPAMKVSLAVAVAMGLAVMPGVTTARAQATKPAEVKPPISTAPTTVVPGTPPGQPFGGGIKPFQPGLGNPGTPGNFVGSGGLPSTGGFTGQPLTPGSGGSGFSGFGPGGPAPALPPVAGSMPAMKSGPGPAFLTRFQFTIAPNTPLKDLLPVAPQWKRLKGPLFIDNLALVPEISFQERVPQNHPINKTLEQTAHQIAKINHLNNKETDGFLKALLSQRNDLSGLTFQMGGACRMKGSRSAQFRLALDTLRQCMGQPLAVSFNGGSTKPSQPQTQPGSGLGVPVTATGNGTFVSSSTIPGTKTWTRDEADDFWLRYQVACMKQDRENAKLDRACEDVSLARIAALMQVLGPESVHLRRGLVKYLAAVAHSEATRALARLALFSPEAEIREAAVDALKVRRGQDYTGVLMNGFRYPWPEVARRAGTALIQLERQDLVPQLVNLLDEADPRLPHTETIKDKKVQVVRRLVRVNHHRNCLLCHAPGNTPDVNGNVVTAEVPMPGQPLGSFSTGYGSSNPDIFVRIDVTYLRQDFSQLMPVADAHPWPEMQRFDFLVQKSAVSDQEAQACREQVQKAAPGTVTPYQRAVLHALRELTGRDTGPTAQAWRELLQQE
jgi:hypothetical protein